MNGQGRQGIERGCDVRGFGGNQSLSDKVGECCVERRHESVADSKPVLFEFVDHASGGKGF